MGIGAWYALDMEKNDLTADAFREALEKRDVATLRKFVGITQLLIFRNGSIRQRICKALGTTVEEIRKWDMSFETRRRIEEILGCAFHHVPAAAMPNLAEDPAEEPLAKESAQKPRKFVIEEAEQIIAGFPIFRGEKYTLTIRTKKFTATYLHFLQELLSQCANDEQQKVLARRERLKLSEVKRALEKLPKEVV